MTCLSEALEFSSLVAGDMAVRIDPVVSGPRNAGEEWHQGGGVHLDLTLLNG